MTEHPSVRLSAVAKSPSKRSPLLRAAVVGSAVAGGFALVIVTGPLRPEVFISAGIAVFISAAVYLAQPRAGTIAFLALGTAICAGCVYALFTVGAVPWLLTSFWAGAATLLAGLLDLIGRDGTDSMIGVTVAAVVSLLVLSALGLGQYVRVTWPLTGKVILESLPQDATGQTSGRIGGTMMIVDQAAGGRWVGRWRIRTRDTVRSWDAFVLAVQADGWDVRANESCKLLSAVKDGHALRVVGQTSDGRSAPGGQGDSAESSSDTLALAAYVSVP